MNKREQMKLARRNEIIQAAKTLVLNNSIQQVQLQDVADAVKIGIATFYRYFPNKELLVLAVHTSITEEMTKTIEQISNEPITAFEMIERIIQYYIDLAEDREHQFVKYMKAFDAYKPPSKDSEEYLKYVQTRREMAQILFSIAEKAKRDSSVKENIDIAQYIFTVVHNISNFTAESYLAEHDAQLPVKIEPKVQLLLMKDIFLQYIRP